MFIAPKILVIDDKKHHMTGLAAAFDELQTSARLLHYVAEDIDTWLPMSGIRLVFIDKNLTELVTTTGSNNTAAFTAIIDALQRVIPILGGPYGLVIWAEAPDLEEFNKFFDERVDRKTFPCPAFCVGMRKTDFIDTGNGDVKDPGKLRDEILSHVNDNPQMSALLHWEAGVVTAMSDVLATLFSLIPQTNLTEGSNENLATLLRCLAIAAAGKEKGLADPKHSAEQVLHALLSDRIDALNTSTEAQGLWKTAISVTEDTAPTKTTKAAINTALHIEYKTEGDDPRFDPTKIGALIEYPFGDPTETLSRNFGITFDDFLSDKMSNLNSVELGHCRLLLARIGAACDDAQPKPGSLTYLLALEWPYANEDGSKTGGAARHRKKSWREETVYKSPEILIGDDKHPGRITFFLNATISVPRETATKWGAIGRLRNEMATTLTHNYAKHLSRLGLIDLR